MFNISRFTAKHILRDKKMQFSHFKRLSISLISSYKTWDNNFGLNRWSTFITPETFWNIEKIERYRMTSNIRECLITWTFWSKHSWSKLWLNSVHGRRIPTVKLKIPGKSIFEIRNQNFCYIQDIVFDLSYLSVAAVET